MVRSIISVLIASALVIIFAPWLKPALNWIFAGYEYLIHGLQFIFARNDLASMINHFIPLFAVPVIIMAAVSLIYWGLRRRTFPWMGEVLWTIWLILAILVIYHI